MARQRTRTWLIAGLLLLSLVVAVLLNLSRVVHGEVTAIPFAITLVLAGLLSPARQTAVIAVLTSAAFLLTAILLTDSPTARWVLDLAGLLTVAVLAVASGIQRAQIAAHARQLEEARQSIERMLAVVAHELGNALTPVRGFVQMLGGAEQPARSELETLALTEIEQGTARLERLMQDLRDTALLQHGTLRVEPEPLDLVGLARRVLDELDEDAERVKLEASAPVEGAWDPLRLHQLLHNLVANALKYSPSESVVVVRLVEHNAVAVLEVIDRGPGISPEEQALVFEPFRRGSAQGRVRGMGLGLYICRAIARAHGGEITVESAVGEGSTFRVQLPNVSAGTTAT